MMELEIIHIADSDRVVKQFTGAPIAQPGFAISGQSGLLKTIGDVLFVRTVKNRGHDLPTQLCGSAAQMHFKHLSNVHTGRNAQRVEQDVERTPIRQIGHILLRQYARDNTFIAVAARHLISNA